MNRSLSLLRYVLLAVGVGLCAWSLSDDLLIGGGPGFGFVQTIVLVAGVIALIAAIWHRAFGALVLVTYCSLFFAIAISEITLRTVLAPKFNSAFQLNDQYLYGLKPGVVKEFTHLPANGGGSHLYRVNSDGFRGDELRDRDESVKRVVVYGDSFIHAIFSEKDATFTERLEQMLAKQKGSFVEVVNAGVAGYGPDQIAFRMQRELSELDPDLVIVSIYSGNDFGDLARNKLFKIDSNGIAVPNTPSIDPKIVFQEKFSERELRVRRLLRNVREAVRQPRSVRDPVEVVNLAFEQQVREYEEFALNGDNVVRELRSDPYSADISLVADTPSAEFKTALMQGVFDDIKKQTELAVIPLVFMIIPHPIDVAFGKHESGFVDEVRWPEYEPDRLTAKLMALCANNDSNCLALLSPFRSKGGVALYLRGGDDHWNDLGQEVAAQEMVDFLEQNTLLK